MKSYKNASPGDSFVWSMLDDKGDVHQIEGIRQEEKKEFETAGKGMWVKKEKVTIVKGGDEIDGVMQSCIMQMPDGKLMELPLVLDFKEK